MLLFVVFVERNIRDVIGTKFILQDSENNNDSETHDYETK